MISTLLEGNKRFVAETFDREKEFFATLAKERVDEKLTSLHIDIPPEQRMQLIVEENVRLQLEHLQEYPFIRSAMREKKVSIHGWVYDMSNGEIKVLQRNTITCRT